MVTDREIQALADKIAAEFKPHKVILFGSYANGSPHEDSDLDLLVVLPFDGPAYETAADIRVALPKTLAIDVIARTPEEFAARYAKGDSFIRSIADHGRVLFAA
jgi:uncharacterized protein